MHDGGKADLRTAHTAQLGQSEVLAIRELVDQAFDGEFSDDDFEHPLGGMHALLWQDGELIGHGSVVMRRLLHSGRHCVPAISRASRYGGTSTGAGTARRS